MFYEIYIWYLYRSLICLQYLQIVGIKVEINLILHLIKINMFFRII